MKLLSAPSLVRGAAFEADFSPLGVKVGSAAMGVAGYGPLVPGVYELKSEIAPTRDGERVAPRVTVWRRDRDQMVLLCIGAVALAEHRSAVN